MTHHKTAIFLICLLAYITLACMTPTFAPMQQTDVKKPSLDGTFTSQAYSVEYETCVQDRVRVRSGAGTNYAELDYLTDGVPVTVIARTKGWFMVEYFKGEKMAEGYVYGLYVCEVK